MRIGSKDNKLFESSSLANNEVILIICIGAVIIFEEESVAIEVLFGDMRTMDFRGKQINYVNDI